MHSSNILLPRYVFIHNANLYELLKKYRLPYYLWNYKVNFSNRCQVFDFVSGTYFNMLLCQSWLSNIISVVLMKFIYLVDIYLGTFQAEKNLLVIYIFSEKKSVVYSCWAKYNSNTIKIFVCEQNRLTQIFMLNLFIFKYIIYLWLRL